MEVGEPGRQGFGIEPAGDDSGAEIGLGHRLPPCGCVSGNYAGASKFYQLENFIRDQLLDGKIA
jgi:hypothetical protein